LCKFNVIDHLLAWYKHCFYYHQEEPIMKKSNAIIAIGLLTASMTVPTGRSYADDDRPGNREQRQELREDSRDLQQLRRQRDRELREGDTDAAREYNEKIRRQEGEVRQDHRQIYRSEEHRERSWWDRLWGRD
jgi:hypothetical protein